LELDLLVGEIVERLQHQHPKHHDRIGRLAAGVTLARVLWRQHNRLNVSAETLPRHQRADRLQRITLRRQRRKPPVCIEEPQLCHHRPLRIMS